jgi:hypothetical protein
MSFKRFIATPFVWLLALFIFLEEWLWSPLLIQLKKLSRWRWIRWLEVKVGKLPPYAALAFFVVPMVVLFPFKFFGLYLLANGFKLLGLTVFALAKVVGTASAAWVYSLTEPALSKLVWFVRLRSWFVDVKHRLYYQVKTSVSYRFVRRRLSVARVWVRAKFSA